MDTGDRYDVFLSYHWRDHERVETLARSLRDKDLSVFLDRWYLVPGRPWPQALEQVLRACRAVAVCVGPGEMGPWQQREVNLALERQSADPSFPVIPILLKDADPVLGFLRQNTWVDLRDEDPAMLEIIALAIRGEPPGSALQERINATLAAICPYRGLLYFREEDEPFFWPRDRRGTAHCCGQAQQVHRRGRRIWLRQVLAGARRAQSRVAARARKRLGRHWCRATGPCTLWQRRCCRCSSHR